MARRSPASYRAGTHDIFKLFTGERKGMIVGLGTDIVDMERVEKVSERFGERFAGHILHPEELAEWRESPRATFLAGRFAAKESALRAIGTGMAEGIG